MDQLPTFFMSLAAAACAGVAAAWWRDYYRFEYFARFAAPVIAIAILLCTAYSIGGMSMRSALTGVAANTSSDISTLLNKATDELKWEERAKFRAVEEKIIYMPSDMRAKLQDDGVPTWLLCALYTLLIEILLLAALRGPHLARVVRDESAADPDDASDDE